MDEDIKKLAWQVADRVLIHIGRGPLREIIEEEVAELLRRIADAQGWTEWPHDQPRRAFSQLKA